MADFSLQALHDEIEADALALGYKSGAVWNGDRAIADLLNAKNYTVDRASISMGDIRSVVPFDEYDGLLIDEQEWLRWLTTGDGELPVTPEIKTKLAEENGGGGIWAIADTDAPAAIKGLIETPGSRAEVLWGQGTVITASNVGGAANQ